MEIRSSCNTGDGWKLLLHEQIKGIVQQRAQPASWERRLQPARRERRLPAGILGAPASSRHAVARVPARATARGTGSAKAMHRRTRAGTKRASSRLEAGAPSHNPLTNTSLRNRISPPGPRRRGSRHRSCGRPAAPARGRGGRSSSGAVSARPRRWRCCAAGPGCAHPGRGARGDSARVRPVRAWRRGRRAVAVAASAQPASRS